MNVGQIDHQNEKAQAIAKAQLMVTETLNSKFPYSTLIEKIIEIICIHFSWDCAEYHEIDPNKEVLKNIFFINYTKMEISEFEKVSCDITHAKSVGLPGEIWEQQQPVWIVDYAKQPESLRSGIAGKVGLHGSSGFPVIFKDKIFGVIDFFSKDIREKDEILLMFMKSVGQQLGAFQEYTLILSEQEKYYQIIEADPHGIWMIDPNNKTIYVNLSMSKLLACKREEVIGFTPFSFMDQKTQAFSAERIWKQRQEEKYLTQAEIKFYRKDGSYFWTNLMATAIFDRNKNYMGAVAIVSDVTEEKKAKEEAFQNEILNRNLIQSVPYGIIIHEKEKILFVNQAIVDMLGFSSTEVAINTPIYKLIHPDYWKVMRQKISEIETTSKSVPRIDGIFLKADGNPLDVEISSSPISFKGKQAILSCIINVTDRKKQKPLILNFTNYDKLTGLGNRCFIEEEFIKIIDKSVQEKKIVSFFLINIDHFKYVNDTFGTESGDKVLKLVSDRLKSFVPYSKNIARLAGDRFIIIPEAVVTHESAAVLAQELIDMFNSPFIVEQQTVNLTITIGISIFPHDGRDFESLLMNADLALKHAKEIGRANFQFHNPELSKLIQNRVSLINNIRNAFINQQVRIFFQPIVSVPLLEIVGFEALLRLQMADGVEVSTDIFIPIADELGLLESFWDTILEESCKVVKNWHEKINSDFYVSVNLSGRQLRDLNLLETVPKILKRVDFKPNNLQLEISESSIMYNPKSTQKLINELRKIGVKFAVDDFGTGYSSLSYLKNFSITSLKIDKSFIKDFVQKSEDLAIVKAIIALGHSVGLLVTAEGVETKDQVDLLIQLGCDQLQGYYFSKPLPPSDIEKLLKKSDPIT